MPRPGAAVAHEVTEDSLLKDVFDFNTAKVKDFFACYNIRGSELTGDLKKRTVDNEAEIRNVLAALSLDAGSCTVKQFFESYKSLYLSGRNFGKFDATINLDRLNVHYSQKKLSNNQRSSDSLNVKLKDLDQQKVLRALITEAGQTQMGLKNGNKKLY